MPANVVESERDEEKWNKAKEQAAKQGHKDDYAYIMGIYKKMKPDHDFKEKSAAYEAGYNRLLSLAFMSTKQAGVPMGQDPMRPVPGAPPDAYTIMGGGMPDMGGVQGGALNQLDPQTLELLKKLGLFGAGAGAGALGYHLYQQNQRPSWMPWS